MVYIAGIDNGKYVNIKAESFSDAAGKASGQYGEEHIQLIYRFGKEEEE